MANLTAFAPYPPVTIRSNIGSAEWRECLAAWLSLATALLRLPDAKFTETITNSSQGVIPFVTAYLHENVHSHGVATNKTSKELHKAVYLLCHRLLSSKRAIKELARWEVLADLAWCYHSVKSLPQLLGRIWIQHYEPLEQGLKQLQQSLVNQLDTEDNFVWQPVLRRLVPLLRVAPGVGRVLALGSEVVESLANSYQRSDVKHQQSIVVFTSLLLLSLASSPKPNYSLLAEHLYTLKVNAKLAQSQSTPSLLTAIVSETPFLDQLTRMSSSSSNHESDKGKDALPPTNLAAGLQEFIDTSRTRKARGRAKNNAGDIALHAVQEDVHFHRMSKVIEIQDMIPGLGSAFVTNLLREYHDNVELAMDHLLSETLPKHLADADRSEQLVGPDGNSVEAMETETILEPRPTPPAIERRNVFDDDEFDRLATKTSNWHIGKARQNESADDMLSSANPNKSAIYASLAAFDSDDDERDDTYDTTDVGGTVDNTVDADRDAALNSNAERILYSHWKTHPADFVKDAQTRHSTQRSRLKQETGWADEQIEGWATMLEREPRRKQQLERRFAEDWQGQQRNLASTAWKAPDDTEDDEDTDGQMRGASRGGRAHRGSFRGGRGRGNAAGAPGESGTQRARRGKEVRGTHNRREGRAKKIARGMAGPP